MQATPIDANKAHYYWYKALLCSLGTVLVLYKLCTNFAQRVVGPQKTAEKKCNHPKTVKNSQKKIM